MAGYRGWRRGGLWILVSFALMSWFTELQSRNLRWLPLWIRSANGSLAVFLLFAVVLLFLLMGAVTRWHHGAGQDSVAVDIIWRVVWITYQVFKVWLIVVAVMLLYRWGRRTSS
jgi:hypothetical protein